MEKSIILMGFMGCGKTSTGRELTKLTDLPLLDTDLMIEEKYGRTISRIFEESGEETFRDMETALLEDLRRSGGTRVISIGGGMPVREQNRKILKDLGTIVYLTASDEVLAGRLAGDTTRPLLAGTDLRERILALRSAREGIYLGLADIVLNTDGLDPAAAAKRVLENVQGIG